MDEFKSHFQAPKREQMVDTNQVPFVCNLPNPVLKYNLEDSQHASFRPKKELLKEAAECLS